MSERFEVGEVIECIRPTTDSTVGKHYTVLESTDYWVSYADDKGDRVSWAIDRFRRPAPAETREVVRYEQHGNWWQWDGEKMTYHFGDGRPSEPATATHEECESWAKGKIVRKVVIRTPVIRPAPAPAKAEEWVPQAGDIAALKDDDNAPKIRLVERMTKANSNGSWDEKCEAWWLEFQKPNGWRGWEYAHNLRLISRPAPCDKPVTTEATPCDKPATLCDSEPLKRQPHEPETIALMRPEELRQFRAGQERREREAAARLTNALHAHDMVQREGSLKSTVDPQTLAAYRALCCERGGGE